MSQTAVMTLTEFLTARLDEEAASANDALEAPTYGHFGDTAAEEILQLAENEAGSDLGVEHFRRWMPARVLAEVAAKRRIVSRCDMVLRGREHDMFGEGQATDARDNLRSLASVYADHPDFDPSWT